MTTVLQARPRQFVSTPTIEQFARRSLRYLQSGYSVHLKGPAGTGKTTLAMHLADLLGQPIMMLFGDDDFKTADLIGNQTGYTRKKVVDNFIHSVVKVEDELSHNWVDSRLTMACREGFTLVYDEFNRSRPEVNNVLLSALEEKLLILPPSGSRQEYVRVHPNFRVIFTSNPEEYCGVHATQDALLDRLITINMPEPDELTQQQILIQKVGIESASALRIVRLARQYLHQISSDSLSSLRPCMMIADICQQHDVNISTDNPDFRDICRDVLLSRAGQSLTDANEILWTLFNQFDNTITDPLTSETEQDGVEPFSETEQLEPSPEPAQPNANISETINPAEHVEAHTEQTEEKTAEQTEDILSTLEVDVAEPLTPLPLAKQSAEAVDSHSTKSAQSDTTLQEKDLALEINPAAHRTDTDSTPTALNRVETEPPKPKNIEAKRTEADLDKATITTPEKTNSQRPEIDLNPVAIAPSISPATHQSRANLTSEDVIHQHLQAIPQARLSQIEKAVGLKRVQVVNALRTLIKQGHVVKRDRPGKPAVYQVKSRSESLVS